MVFHSCCCYFLSHWRGYIVDPICCFHPTQAHGRQKQQCTAFVCIRYLTEQANVSATHRQCRAMRIIAWNEIEITSLHPILAAAFQLQWIFFAVPLHSCGCHWHICRRCYFPSRILRWTNTSLYQKRSLNISIEWFGSPRDIEWFKYCYGNVEGIHPSGNTVRNISLTTHSGHSCARTDVICLSLSVAPCSVCLSHRIGLVSKSQHRQYPLPMCTNGAPSTHSPLRGE